MTLIRLTVQGLPYASQKKAVVYRVRGAIRRHVLHDLKVMLQPDQAPASLVTAVALGTMLSFIPVPVLDTLLVGVIIARYRRVNRSALLIARFFWNDFVVVPLYVTVFRLGMRLLDPFFANNTTITVRVFAFSLGLLIVASAATVASSAVVFCFVTVLRQRQGSSFRRG